MAIDYATEPLKIGTFVRIRDSGYGQAPAQVTEFRGPLGPNGARIYGVRVGKKKPAPYLEVREDQLEVLAYTPPND